MNDPTCDSGAVVLRLGAKAARAAKGPAASVSDLTTNRRSFLKTCGGGVAGAIGLAFVSQAVPKTQRVTQVLSIEKLQELLDSMPEMTPWEKAHSDMLAYGTGMVFLGIDRTVRHVPLSDLCV